MLLQHDSSGWRTHVDTTQHGIYVGFVGCKIDSPLLLEEYQRRRSNLVGDILREKIRRKSREEDDIHIYAYIYMCVLSRMNNRDWIKKYI